MSTLGLFEAGIISCVSSRSIFWTGFAFCFSTLIGFRGLGGSNWNRNLHRIVGVPSILIGSNIGEKVGSLKCVRKLFGKACVNLDYIRKRITR